MKTDFLKNLGITEQSTIDAIMAENGRDVTKAKTDLETYRNRVTDLEGQIATKDSEIATLKTQVGDTTALNQKITELEADKTKLTTDLDTKVGEIKKAHAIENDVRDAKAKNVKAVIALLDMSKITYNEDKLEGLSEQLTALQGDESTSFLFGEAQSAPAGTKPSNPPANGGNAPTSRTFADAVANALKSN